MRVHYKDVQDTLPDKPSELLEVALADLEKVAKDSRFAINMSTWYTTSLSGQCVVCAAGAVMAKTLRVGALDGRDLGPSSFSGSLSEKLLAINCLREGCISAALYNLHLDRPDNLPYSVPMASYETQKDLFYIDARKLIAMLRNFNL